MATQSIAPQNERLAKKLDEVEDEYDIPISDLFAEINRTQLGDAGKRVATPYRDEYSLRWVMKWDGADSASYELSIVFRVEDTGSEARIAGIWVRRHASMPFDFDGDTPTTHMRRVTDISMDGIRAAVEAEMG